MRVAEVLDRALHTVGKRHLRSPVQYILRPNDTTVVAHWVGVARGADLMLYGLIIAFVFTTLSAYLRFKDLELRYARLARAIALEGARTPDGEA